jgi:hypothetical protein
VRRKGNLTMRRLALALTVAVTATTAVAHDDFKGHRSSAEECSARNTSFGDDRRSYVKKEIIDASGLRSIKARVENAPISVEGGSAGGYQITVCKAAEELTDLDAIRVRLEGN